MTGRKLEPGLAVSFEDPADLVYRRAEVTILREAGAAPVAEVAKKYSDRVGDSR